MDIIRERRSVRRYKDKALSADIINSLLEAAKFAPTARNLQQLEYKVITNKDLIKKISDRIAAIVKKEYPSIQLRDRSNLFYDAPLLIVVTGPKENIWTYSDAALAVQNIMLYATSLYLGTCFIGMARFIERDEELLRELHILNDRKVAAAVICGYADEKPAEKEKKMNVEFLN
ncbi:MAG TPA: nitroreductase family protein [Candidatus Bathyarchaeia archaeon]|nr:nitroreductase family protein [Candidatus Bathyarchaeia archaeon]